MFPWLDERNKNEMMCAGIETGVTSLIAQFLGFRDIRDGEVPLNFMVFRDYL